MVKSPHLQSLSEADEQLNTAGRPFTPILLLVACTALSIFLCFIMPAGIAVLFAVYLSLATLGVVYIGVERFVRRHRGPALHVEHGAVTLYPYTTVIRFSFACIIMMMAWGPASVAFYLVRPESVISIVIGFCFSFLAYTLFVTTKYRPSRIHRSPLITLGPDHLSIQPLLHDNPTRIRWDRNPQIEGFELFVANKESHQLMHVSTRDSEDALIFNMKGMPICYWQLARLINHFVAHPEDRATLGTPEGPQLVTDILAAG